MGLSLLSSGLELEVFHTVIDVPFTKDKCHVSPEKNKEGLHGPTSCLAFLAIIFCLESESDN